MSLPSFPVDDMTLDAIDHALGASIAFDADDVDLERPRLVGAEYSLSTLLDFIGGTMGSDPNEEVVDPGDPDLPGYAGARVVIDSRVHYSERDVIAALVTEVRRLRGQQ